MKVSGAFDFPDPLLLSDSYQCSEMECSGEMYLIVLFLRLRLYSAASREADASWRYVQESSQRPGVQPQRAHGCLGVGRRAPGDLAARGGKARAERGPPASHHLALLLNLHLQR